MGKRRKIKEKVPVQFFKTLETRIAWFVLKVIDTALVIPYKKLFPQSSISKCQWCGSTDNLTVINALDYKDSPIAVCTNVPECNNRYWSKGF